MMILFATKIRLSLCPLTCRSTTSGLTGHPPNLKQQDTTGKHRQTQPDHSRLLQINRSSLTIKAPAFIVEAVTPFEIKGVVKIPKQHGCAQSDRKYKFSKQTVHRESVGSHHAN